MPAHKLSDCLFVALQASLAILPISENMDSMYSNPKEVVFCDPAECGELNTTERTYESTVSVLGKVDVSCFTIMSKVAIAEQPCLIALTFLICSQSPTLCGRRTTLHRQRLILGHWSRSSALEEK